ncbi:MAG: VOC family protein [Ignavibacteriaceae bacterium]|jgi:predicted 3-demethylubiquinone-9 3-methyltransferase (glyoxalase superfamily)
MQKITPFLWFDNNAEEAVEFYTSIFGDSKEGNATHYEEQGAKVSGQPKDSVMTVPFQLLGQDFVALNGGPIFKINPAVSFFVNCKTEDEVERLWDKLSDGGKALMPLDKYHFSEKYGWIQDKFGVSWQLILSVGEIKQSIVPSMLFVGNVCGRAEEAINFYTSLFNDSKVLSTFRYGANQQPDKEGTIAFADFILDGQIFAAMDSAHSHDFTFNDAISFVVNCETQKEVDYFWGELSEGGAEVQCGWLKDKFGLSWQVIPTALGKLFSSTDPEKTKRVMGAMLQMKKLIIADLQKAYDGN